MMEITDLISRDCDCLRKEGLFVFRRIVMEITDLI